MTHAPAPFDPAAQGWKRLDFAGFAAFIGPFWGKEVDGAHLVGLLTEARHANRNGTVHGGVLLSLADQAFALGTTAASDTRARATIQLNLQFIRAVTPGSFVVARSVLQRQTRSMAFMSGELLVDDEIVASGTGVWKLIGTAPAG